ncbi:MAG: hypothetical protein ABW019_08460, partial [Chitinophagaceae bacterium]
KEGLSISGEDILLLDVNAHSFDFYRNYNHAITNPKALEADTANVADKYFLIGSDMAREMEANHFHVQPVVSHVDYNVTTLKLKFLNPGTRLSKCDTLMLAKIYR